MSITSSTKPWSPETGGRESASLGVGSDQTTLFSDARSSLVSSGVNAGKYKEIEISQSGTEGSGSEELSLGECNGSGNGGEGREGREEEEIIYPGPLKLFILVVGIALSVFLISLDRTIITTVSPLPPPLLPPSLLICG